MIKELPKVYENVSKEIKTDPSRVLSIELTSLTASYLEQLENLIKEHFEKAGEYLCITSFFAYLKSRLLLPREPSPKQEPFSHDLPDHDISSLSELRALLEKLQILGENTFVSPGLPPPDPDLEVSLDSLLKAFLNVLERLHPPTVEVKRLEPIFKKMLSLVITELHKNKRLFYGNLASKWDQKIEKIILFLAILELSFRETCRLIQNLPWGEIEILLRESRS